MSLLVGILVSGGLGYFAWASDVPAEVWIIQTESSRIDVRCWKDDITYYDTLTVEKGVHAHLLPSGEWECHAYAEEANHLFWIKVIRRGTTISPRNYTPIQAPSP